jgi:hypothetical protein
MRKKIYLYISGLLLLLSCENQLKKANEPETGSIGSITEKMTDVMVHDITNPPLAARFYAYACLAGYEVISHHDHKFASMLGVLNDYPDIDHPKEYHDYHVQLTALLAMVETAAAMQPSGKLLLDFKKELLDSWKKEGFSAPVLNDSEAYAKYISKKILAYAQEDKYRELSNYPRYTPSEQEGSWYPTPPGYFTPVEPYFNTVRPFLLEKADQFKPAPPTGFSTTEGSGFYQMMKEVYEVDLTGENREIAAFWDCNPFALEETGHLMVGIKQISPGGHWMGITDIACKQAGLSFAEALEVHTWVATGLMDGFISCWDEKYRSHRIRPETAIRKYLDPHYQPMLQTPPFPEYLSGHSTISTTTAVILTHFFGEDFPYTDTVEEKYGLGTRDFQSFHQAAEEASISRLYGGIHFMDAIVNGQQQGKQVGNWIVNKYKSSLKNHEKMIMATHKE